MSNTTNPKNAAAQLRMAWIERQTATSGTFRINDGAAALGVSRAQISADIAALQTANPGAITYDIRGKTYRWTPGSKIITTLPAFVRAVNVTDINGTTILRD